MKPTITILQFQEHFAGIWPFMHTAVVIPVDVVWSSRWVHRFVLGNLGVEWVNNYEGQGARTMSRFQISEKLSLP